MNKKGQALDKLGALAIGILSVAVILVVGFLIVAQAQDQIVSIDGVDETNATTIASTATAGYNASVTLQEAMGDIPAWVPIIVITFVGVILLGLVGMFRKSY